MSRKQVRIIAFLFAALLLFTAQAGAQSEKTAEAKSGTPIIDGEIDELWSSADIYEVNGFAVGVSTDTKAQFRAMWDAKYLYVLVEVDKHGIPVYDGFVNENNDAPEIAWSENANFEGTGNVNTDDPSAGIFRVDANNELSGLGLMPENAIAEGSFKAEFKKVADDKYQCEFAIPFNKVTPTAGTVVSFECQVNINSANAGRDAIIYWTETGNAWTNSSDHGALTLVAAPSVETAAAAETESPAVTEPTPAETTAAPSTSDAISIAAAAAFIAFAALRKKK